MSETVILVFMVFSALICAFSIIAVTREIIVDAIDRRKGRNAVVETKTDCATLAEAAASAAVAALAAQKAISTETAVTEVEIPVEEPAVEEYVEVEETVVEPFVEETVESQNEKAVRFQPKQVETIDEKYLKLNAEQRGYYDQIICYAAAKENAKRFKNARYEEYKVGKTRLVRTLIKRGVITCEFILPNADFKSYIAENKVSVKHAPSIIKVVDEASLQAAKDSMDIVIRAAEEEKEYKKQLARERRRIARANERAAKAAQEAQE